jgi:hypothetical protein
VPLRVSGIQKKIKLDYPIELGNDKEEESSIKKDILWMIKEKKC